MMLYPDYYKEIPYDNDAEMDKMITKTYLVVSKDWIHADVATLDADLGWYSPVDGSDFSPIPTHYMEIPKLND